MVACKGECEKKKLFINEQYLQGLFIVVQINEFFTNFISIQLRFYHIIDIIFFAKHSGSISRMMRHLNSSFTCNEIKIP